MQVTCLLEIDIETFTREKLSKRENEILDHAIDGLTDQQIALALDIQPSTVNSYWVRIRGKLGSKSRTELVSETLRSQARRDMSDLMERNQVFEDAAKLHHRLEGDVANAEMYRAALEALPEAMFITNEEGFILYANERLLKLFDYQLSELLNESVDTLFAPVSTFSAHRAQYLKDREPMRLGIDQVLYAKDRKGNLIRVIVLFDMLPYTKGFIASWVVQSFVHEVDSLRRNASLLSIAAL